MPAAAAAADRPPHVTLLRAARPSGFDQKLNLCRRGTVTQLSDLVTLRIVDFVCRI